MARFEELQELWQGQAGPRRVERRNRGADPVAAALRTATEVGFRRQGAGGLGDARVGASRRCHRPNQIAGLLLVGVAAAVLLIVEWRSQRRIARLDFTAPSLPFVQGRDRTFERPIESVPPRVLAVRRRRSYRVDESRSRKRPSDLGPPGRLGRFRSAASNWDCWFRRKRFERRVPAAAGPAVGDAEPRSRSVPNELPS